MPRRFAFMFLLMLSISWVGCHSGWHRPTSTDDIDYSLLRWPPPPSIARIRFEQSISQPIDLGIRESVWGRLVSWMAGQEQLSFVRPTDVTAKGSMIFVADPGAQSLWLIDTQRGQLQRLQKLGKHQLISPISVTMGPEDSIYLTDSVLGMIFHLKQRDGTVLSSITSKHLKRPTGVAYDGVRHRLYVADSAGHRVHVFSDEERVVDVIGRRGGGDGEFNHPTHVALDREGKLYVTDAMGFRIQIFDPEGKFLVQFGRHGDTAGSFASPKGVGVDSAGHIYVVEALFDAVQVFDQQGRHLLTFGERGVQLGQFWLPGGIFIDDQDRIFVADTYNQRIQVFQYLHNSAPN